jgi:hypothetical protein
MAEIVWHAAGARKYETGVDHGVLYHQDPTTGNYNAGFAWNGLISVTESPGGAESTKLYADNIEYLNLVSAETFSATIEAYTYPDEFAQNDGSAEPVPGVTIGQQTRLPFGLAYRTRVGNELLATDYGYKLHLIYGGQAAPTEKGYTTINDSPDAVTFSWEVSTTAVDVPGFKPTAQLTIDSTKVDAGALDALEDILYGRGAGGTPRLPKPAEVFALFEDFDPTP